ncbi:hypothetical protein L7F22_018309 [Adiantum nelumboides]|nr:hypothetical protein [Adiantum nelumboides]
MLGNRQREKKLKNIEALRCGERSCSREDLELSKFLNQFQDVFIDDIPGELPPKRGDDDHAIELIPGSSPPNKPPYRVSQAQQEEIMRQVNELVEKGMVKPSSSPFCSPVLLVHKKDGTYCMCVDYRALNKITIKNRFPVPCIEDLFDKLQGSTYFSRIDLKSGYHQIRIVKEDIVKIAFRTTFGLYEYLVMSFGLTNAPVTFNRMMERIFRPHRNFTGVFFDDVIILSKSMEEHKKHLQFLPFYTHSFVFLDYCKYEEDRMKAVYVDDLTLTGDHEEKISQTKEALCTEFEMTDLGLMHFCLGIEVWQESDKIFISQKKYVGELLKAFGLSECETVSTPFEVNAKLSREDASPLVDVEIYRRLVGGLIYLCNTRPDICEATGVLSRFSNKPRENHWYFVYSILF